MKLFKSVDKQELFDFAYKGVMGQGVPAWDSMNACCVYHKRGYLGEEIKCSVGHTLSGHGMQFANEHAVGIEELLHKFQSEHDVSDAITKSDIEFVVALQDAHDSAVNDHPDASVDEDFLENFDENMRKLAEKHSLTVPE